MTIEVIEQNEWVDFLHKPRAKHAVVAEQEGWTRSLHAYNPDQPRAPKGEPTGGQWVDADGDDDDLISAVDRAAITGHKDQLDRHLKDNGFPSTATLEERAKVKEEIVRRLTERLRGRFTEEEAKAFLTSFMGYTEGQDPYEQVSQSLVDAWARSSGDSNSRAIAVQLRARELFDLDDFQPSSWDSKSYTMRDAREFAGAHRKVIDSGLTAMYEQTQADLERAGIDEAILYRGMAVRQMQDGLHVGQLPLQPLSSFTSSRLTAAQFAADWASGDDAQVMMAIRVPRDKIFSTARTGLGCLSESEFVVLGQKGGHKALYAKAPKDAESDGDWFRDLIHTKAMRPNG